MPIGLTAYADKQQLTQQLPRNNVKEKAPIQSPTIGVATMQNDGTIIMDLRSEGPGGMIGDARDVVRPNDPAYADVLKHLGGIKPGETKRIRPWD